MSSESKNLRILNPQNFVNPNNMMRIESVRDESDKQAKLSSHPQYAGLSYYAQSGRKYKDLTQFLKKFRCKHCHVHGLMKAIAGDKKTPHIIQALICANCSHIAPLEMPIDRNNIGRTSTGIDKRPLLVGKNTKFKMPLSEVEKMGFDKALTKGIPNRRIGNSKTKLISDDLSDKPNDSIMKTIHKHLRRANLPISTHSTIHKVEDIDKQDYEFSEFMRGMGIVKQVTTPPEKVRQGIFLY